MATPRLDRSKPFNTVFGDCDYSYKQGNRCFDGNGNFLKFDGEEPKVEDAGPDEAALRAQIRAEVEAEVAETHRAKVRAGIEAARAVREQKEQKKAAA